jgi:hypothetical protein
MDDGNLTSGKMNGPNVETGLPETGHKIALIHFEHVERQVQLAAAMAAIIVTADALMLNAYLKAATDYKVFITLGTVPSRWFFVGGLLLLLGFVAALLTVFPNIWGSGTENILFFGSIASIKEQDYVTEFRRAANRGQLDECLLRQIHAKSRWLKKMFVSTIISICSIIVGTCICVFVLYDHSHMLPGLGKP